MTLQGGLLFYQSRRRLAFRRKGARLGQGEQRIARGQRLLVGEGTQLLAANLRHGSREWQDAFDIVGRMQRYVAFLRGVTPMNAKMPDLRRAFEAAGFTEVKTVLASGNVVFSAPAATNVALARKVEAAMREHLGQAFPAIVRPVEALQRLLESEPFAAFPKRHGEKRVVTFLRERPEEDLGLPIEEDGARILLVQGREAFSAYVRSPRGPVFMRLIEKTFGKACTTRTWETVAKVAR